MREIFSGSNAAWLENLCGDDAYAAAPEWRGVIDSVSPPAGDSRGSVEQSIKKSECRGGNLDCGEDAPQPRLGPVASAGAAGTAGPADGCARYQDKQHRVDGLVNAYRELGYLYAGINPLGSYMPPNLRYAWITQTGIGRELDLATYGLNEGDLDKVFVAPWSFETPRASLRDIIARLAEVYTGPMGVEILHIRNRAMRRWLIKRLEGRSPLKNHGLKNRDNDERRRRQRDLIRAEEFEAFIQSRFTGQKRFSLEGTEALIPALRRLFGECGRLDVSEIIMGMAHRGRLNVLANAMVKPSAEIFAMFDGHYSPHSYGGSGDVKYHQGQSVDYRWSEGKTIHISLVSNPSHLEAVDPVVQGKARGSQRLSRDSTRKKVIPVLIHGDAAFSGQGIVAETFNMSQLQGYRTGGTIHFVVNNQIGFTTASSDSRSTFFATDIAKVMPVPVFHANGDDPDAVMRSVELALQWRQKFGQDVVVDIIGYRRLGHNEADEPSFTHPIMYNLIRRHESVSKIFGRRLDEEGVFPQAEQAAFRSHYIQRLKEVRDEASEYTDFHGFQTLSGSWSKIKRGYSFDFPETGVSEDVLRETAERLNEVPEGFKIHRKLQRLIDGRRRAMDEREGIDWSFAESLAFGTLLAEGRSVRLSGEDCGRGTFSQRHAVWWDVSTESPRQHTPLESLAADGARFSVYDSPLSEFSILGFEYGYSTVQPEILVLWEAQFGDFANGAQVIIDQFVGAGESKWARHSGLVMLLPHAYEGQGPEHSNAYLERYLSLCAEENMQVVNPTTPAQYFHVLRKQLHQKFRKPLIIMTPKSLLRLPEARSRLDEFTGGVFQTVLSDKDSPPVPRRLILCSGHVWYDLVSARAAAIEKDSSSPTAETRILRLEQIYPFPEEHLHEQLADIGEGTQLIWAQEEPANRGAWSFLAPRLERLTGRGRWEYAGRPASASPAAGSHDMHIKEKNALIEGALGAA